MSGERVRIGALAKEVDLSVGWLRKLADDGAIPSVRSGSGHRRFDVEAVRDALARRQQPVTVATAATVVPQQHPQWNRSVSLAGLEEHEVWADVVADLQLDRSSLAVRIMTYAFTEMLNNAIDHSEATQAQVSVWSSTERLGFAIRDDGVGVFRRLRTGLRLDDDFTSIQELTKGKRTTAPDKHTGEGIFFSSKAVDLFQLTSAGLRWTVDNIRADVAVGDAPHQPGTLVYAEISPATTRELQQLFQQFTVDFEFVRTRPVVKLFGLGMTFVSRSEARRLLDGLDEFTEVEVDFNGVTDVGQGFVDELLRVWPSSHPGKRVIPVNMSEAVEFMVRRGLPVDAAGTGPATGTRPVTPSDEQVPLPGAHHPPKPL